MGDNTQAITNTYIEAAGSGEAAPDPVAQLSAVAQAVDSHADLFDETQKSATMLFWECGHPDSGMIADRVPVQVSEGMSETQQRGGENVVTGATGFGIMALIAAANNGWLQRGEARARINKIAGFLSKAETYRGVFPHMMNGSSGEIRPFAGPSDKGGDIVETAFLMVGLLTARQYFNSDHADDAALRGTINTLWEKVEWDAFVRHQYDRPHLFWLLSNNALQRLSFQPMKMQTHVRGYNEGLPAFLLGAMSPTHALPKEIYFNSWATGADFHGQAHFGVNLKLGAKGGGPLFYGPYAFAGFDPNGLKDRFADYGDQMRDHARMAQAFAVDRGHNPDLWGLSTCDGEDGQYRVRAPFNHDGTFNPLMMAAYRSVLPVQAGSALATMQRLWNERLWGRYGLKGAFNPASGWVGQDYLANDVLSAAVGMANGADGFLWKLFMSSPEIAKLKDLGFESPYIAPAQKPVALAPALS